MIVLSWLSSIGESISIFVQFIGSMLTGILSVFSLVGQSFAFLGVAWGYMPSVLLVFCTAAIAIIIVFQLIGR